MQPRPLPTHNFLFFLGMCGLFAVCPLLFFTDLTRNPYYTQIALLNIFVGAIWVYWLVQAWKQKEVVWFSSVLDLPLVVLFIISMMSWISSMIWHPRFLSAIYSEGSKGIIFFITNTYLVYAAALRSQNRERMVWMLWITYAASTFAAVYGIAQYFGTEWFWPHNLNPYGSRPVSTFGNPNFMSSYLVMIIPVMVADFFLKVTGIPRVMMAAAIVSTVGALVATLTRSSWLGLIVSFAFVGYGITTSPGFKKPSKNFVFIGVALVVLLFALWPKGDNNGETVGDRLGEIRALAKGGQYAPVSQRLLIWTSAWTMVEEHPLLGKGWGCFELFYPFYQGPLLLEKAFRSFRTHANNAHNEVLEYWSQTGTLGIGIVVAMWIVFFRSAFSIARRLSGTWRGLFWGFVGGVAGMLVDNLLNVSIHFAVPAMVFWWWVGTVFTFDPDSKRIHRIPLQGWRWGVMAVTIVGLILLMVRAFCLWEMEVHFFDGFKHSKRGELGEAATALQSAYAWHPLEVNNDYELGNVYARMNQQDRAIVMYQRALAANAGYDEIYFNQATMMAQMGNTAQAMEDYRICLDINPLSHDAYNALVAIYLKDLKHYGNAAEALYLQGVDLFPEDKDMWNNLGYLYTQRSQWDLAADAYRHSLQIDPTFGTAQKNLAAIAVHLKPI